MANSMAMARGIRNNNPGNVEWHPTKDPWMGIAEPPSDGRFCRFVAPVWGLRVIVKLLRAYQRYHGCRTVADLLNRWAPAFENDTAAYAQTVADAVGVGVREPVDVLSNKPLMVALLRAIVKYENGTQPYDDATLAEAVAWAED